jgi:hypothetical protein
MTTRRTKRRRKPRHIVIITGNRSWEDDPIRLSGVALVLLGLRDWYGHIHLFHGVGRGVDQMGADAALADRQFERNEITEHPYPVDWNAARKALGAGWRAAGHKRNEVMVAAALALYDEERGDTIECWSFTDNIREQSGTRHCARYAAKHGIPTFVVGVLDV